MSLDRIHVYEIVSAIDEPGPGRRYRARVHADGGPLPIGADVDLFVLDAADCGGDADLERVLAAHGTLRGADASGLPAPLDYGLLGARGERRFWSASTTPPGRRLSDLIEGLDALPNALSEALATSLADVLVHAHAAGLAGIGLDPSRVLVREDGSAAVLEAALGMLWERDAAASAASDLFALGCLIFRCMTGVPFDSPVGVGPDDAPSRRPNEVRHAASAFLSEVVHVLLDPDESERFTSAAALAEVLRERRDGPWWRDRRVRHRAYTFDRESDPGMRRDPEPPPIPPPAPVPDPEWFGARGTGGAELAATATPCVGREAEFALLHSRAASLATQGGQVVLLEGVAGVGKTRLLTEVRSRCGDVPGLVVLRGDHRPLGIGRPMQAFSEAIVRWIAGDCRDVSVDDVRPLLGDATAVAEAFAAFLSGAPVPEGAERLTRESLASAFLACLRTLSRRGPVLFVVENLQWADPEGLDVFAHLARACETLPLLLIGSYRPPASRSPLSALLAAMSVLQRHRTIVIGPLGRAAAAEMARALIRPAAAADAVLSALDASLAGLPEAVIAAAELGVADGGLVRAEAGGYDARGSAVGRPLPGTLGGLIDARIEGLAPGARELLEVCAVQGVAFDGDVGRRALGLSDADGRERFAALADAAFVVGAHPVWQFAGNSLFQRVHDGIDDTRLQAAHEATAGAFLDSRNPDQLPPSEVHGILGYRVAWHYMLAGRDARGQLYLGSALRHLRETWRIGDAERLAELACRALTRTHGRRGDLADLLVQRAEFLGLQGRRVEQREVLDDALLRAGDLGDPVRRARIVLASAALRLAMGQWRRSRDEAREALRHAVETDDARLEAQCMTLLGSVAFHDGRFQEARTHLHRVLELSRRLADAAAEAEALRTLGSISQDVGSWDHAEELQRLAMGIYRRSGDLVHEAEVLASLGAIAAATDDAARAEQYVRRALAIHRAVGDGYGESRDLGHLGLVLQDAFRLTEARELHVAACRAAREVGARHDELAALVNLATTELLLGLPDDSRDHYGDALRSAREIGDVRLEGYALTGLGDVARMRGELTVAAGLLERAVAQFDTSGDVVGQATARLAAGRVALLRGEDDLAESVLEDAIAMAQAVRVPTVSALALALQALISARRGDVDGSSARFSEAEDEASSGAAGAMTRAELSFCQSLAARVRRDTPAADRHVIAAERELRAIADGLPEEARTAFLTGASPARDITAGAAAARATAETRAETASE